MEELLVVIVQFLIELLGNVLTSGLLDWPARQRHTPDPQAIWPVAQLYLLGGLALGWLLTHLWWPHTFIHWPSLRMLNLVAAPVASAYLAQALAQRRVLTRPHICPRNHFWYAFWMALGFALSRLAFAVRS